MDPDLLPYLVDHSGGDDPVYAYITEQTQALRARSEHGLPGPLSPLVARFFTLLVRTAGARDAVEVGTFTGTSSVAIARGLPADGTLLCLDVSEEWTGVAREAWTRAGVADRVELRIGPALDALRAMPAEPAFDLAFVDADKEGYVDYLHELVPRLRTGGVLLADNALWGGRVADPAEDHPTTVALRTFNDAVRADDRLDSMILPLGDGLTFARRR